MCSYIVSIDIAGSRTGAGEPSMLAGRYYEPAVSIETRYEGAFSDARRIHSRKTADLLTLVSDLRPTNNID